MPTTKKLKQRRRRSRVVVQRAVAGAPSAILLTRFARAAAPPGAEVTLRVVGAPESKRLNGKYRAMIAPTNVLSFPYGGGSGDLVLCHPVIRKEAKKQRKTLAAHYAHIVVHGILHLRGHDHANKSDAARMERWEIRTLRRLGFGDPYAIK